MNDEEIRKAVREKYGTIASQGKSEAPFKMAAAGCCGPAQKTEPAKTVQSSNVSCCSPQADMSKAIGYSDTELASIPEGANLGLGCGNPTALASLKKGEVVLDLGAGAGIDCFLAARAVGPTGRAIGVDMTAEMVERARANAAQGGYRNVEFRLGEIENLPAADNSVDAIISNRVINLSPNKERVFQEAYRVLKPGGRIMDSDIVLEKPLPESVRSSVEAYVGCVAGASLKKDYLKQIEAAGFRDVKIAGEATFPVEIVLNDPMGKSLIEQSGMPVEKVTELVGYVKSIRVQGTKPV